MDLFKILKYVFDVDFFLDLDLEIGSAHAVEIATLSLDLVDRIQLLEIPRLEDTSLRLRIGCHSGTEVFHSGRIFHITRSRNAPL